MPFLLHLVGRSYFTSSMSIFSPCDRTYAECQTVRRTIVTWSIPLQSMRDTIPPISVLTTISQCGGIGESFHVNFQVTVYTYFQCRSWEGKHWKNPPCQLSKKRNDGVGWNPTSSSEFAFRGGDADTCLNLGAGGVRPLSTDEGAQPSHSQFGSNSLISIDRIVIQM